MRFLCQNDFGITKSLDPTATLSVHLHSRTLVTLIPVMLRFVWPFNRNTDIICLFSGKLGEFGVPSSLHFDVFPVESFIQFSAFYNFNAATAAAIPLGLLTLMILIIERLFLRKKTFQLRLTREPMIIVPLGKSMPFFLSAVIIAAFILVITPIGTLFIKSFSLQAYHEAFIQATDSIVRSLLYASAGATCLTILGLFRGGSGD